MSQSRTWKVESDISIFDIYGSIDSDKFKNWEFRPPKKGEVILCTSGEIRPVASTYHQSNPRLIKPNLRKWVVEETGEVRCPKLGEYYLQVNKKTKEESFQRAPFDFEAVSLPILKVTEVKE